MIAVTDFFNIFPPVFVFYPSRFGDTEVHESEDHKKRNNCFVAVGMPRDDDETSDISFNGESVVFESNTKSTASFGKVCDIEGLWKSIFFWVDNTNPTDTKVKPSITTPYSNSVRSETDEERKKRLENEFQSWLTGKANKESVETTAPPLPRSLPPITPVYNNTPLASGVSTPVRTVQDSIDEERARKAVLSSSGKNSSNDLTATEAKQKALEEAKKIAKADAERLRQKYQQESKAQDPVLGDAELESFEMLLGTEGLMALVYLPTREGGSKSKNAILRCERRSNTITCEISSQGQKKKLKFDVQEIMLVSKGKGPTIKLPSECDVARVMHFNIKGKPELNLELESASCRDAVVEGFNYVINKRLNYKVDLMGGDGSS